MKLITPLTMCLISIVVGACSSDNLDSYGSDSFGDSAILADEPTSAEELSLAASIRTGANADDFDSFWSCSVNEHTGNTLKMDMRFWSDATGFVGRGKLDWSIEGPDSVQLNFDDGTRTTLSQLVVSQHQLSAVSSFNEFISCDWFGPARNIFDDGQTGAQNETTTQNWLSAKNADGSTPQWLCSYETSDIDPGKHLIQFFDHGIGTLNDQAMYWFVDELSMLNISHDYGYLTIDQVALMVDENGEKSFTSTVNGTGYSCTVI